jgi:outer membrane protein TolC
MLAALAADASAQEAAAVVPLTVAEAVDRARAASPRVDELRSLRAAAAADLDGAKAGRMPIADLSAAYTRYSKVAEFQIDVPGLGPTTLFPDLPNQFRTRAEVAVPVYTGGRVSGTIAAAEHQLAAADKDVTAGVSDLVLETTNAYWSLVATRAAARVLAESIESYEADLRQVRDRAEVGLAARGDVLAVEVERDRAELSRLSAENAAAVANEDLVRLTALPPGTRIEPVDSAPDAAAVEPVEALVAQALEARPEIAALRARVAAGEGRARAAGADKRPQASVNAGLDYSRPNYRTFPLEDRFDDSWSVGVNLSFRVFDGGRTSARVARVNAETDATRHRLADLERHVRLDVASRALDLRTQVESLAVAERALASAQENRNVAQDRYREGLVPASELLDAQTRVLRAGLDRTEAAARVRQARASLDRAVGR